MTACASRQRPLRAGPAVLSPPRATISSFFIARFFVQDRTALGGGATFSGSIRAQGAREHLVGSAAEPFLVRALVRHWPGLILWAFVFHGAPEEKAKTRMI